MAISQLEINVDKALISIQVIVFRTSAKKTKIPRSSSDISIQINDSFYLLLQNNSKDNKHSNGIVKSPKSTV